MNIPSLHIPVLLDAVNELFQKQHLFRFLDGTVGLGGHAFALLSAHPEIQEYWAVDQDLEALSKAREKLKPFGDTVHFLHANFASSSLLTPPFDGILLDIGVSSLQLDQPQRGFSFMRDGPLDMRMNSDSDEETAADIVNRWKRCDLERIFFEYGEERKSRKIADAICEARRKKPFSTTKELADLIEKILGRFGPIHPATRVFQALRIQVNHELDVLRASIPQLASLLSSGGIFSCITFHSLEDRIVKQEFQKLAVSKEFQHLIKKPLQASREECRANPRSRSAKLRAIQKYVS